MSGIGYFVTVPKPPPEFAHQDQQVELVEYLVREGDKVQPGTPIATVENWWALFQIAATGPGYVSKTFFEPGTRVKIGDPFAIIVCDGEDAPAGRRPAAHLSVLHVKWQKPPLT